MSEEDLVAALDPAESGERKADPEERAEEELDPAESGAHAAAAKKQPQTHLGKALRAKGLHAVAEALEAQGYQEFADLGDKQEEVRKAIRNAYKDVKDGDLRVIVGMWKKSRKGCEPLTPPELPPKTTLDLTAPSLKWEDVEFAWPAMKPTSGAESWKTAAGLSVEEWIAIARQTHMTYGLHLERVACSRHDEDGRAEKAALLWKVPEGDAYLFGQAKSEVVTTLSYTAQEAGLVHNRIMSIEGSVGVPFVAAAAEVSREAREASLQLEKRLRMTGRSRYQAAEINLDECTELSPAFVKGVDEALKQSDDGARFKGLSQLFDTYGHVYPRRVLLGGQLFFCSERVVRGSVIESEVKDTVAAAVTAKFSGGKASASAKFSDGNSNNITAQSIQEQASFECVGGDVTLVKEPERWQQTCQDPARWAVIDRGLLRAIIDRLPPETQERVQKIWKLGVSAAWDHPNPPLDYVFPDFTDPFAIFMEGDNGSVVVPESVSGETAALSGRHVLAGALAGGAAWVLQYAGRTEFGDGRGRALYFIVEYQDDELSAARAKAIEEVDALNALVCQTTGKSQYPRPSDRVAIDAGKREGKWAVCCVAYHGVPERPEQNSAVWMLIPCPDRRGGDDGSKVYKLKNLKTGRYFGGVKTEGSKRWVELVEASRADRWVLRKMGA